MMQINHENPFRLDRSEAVTCDMNHGYTAEQKGYNGVLADKLYNSPIPLLLAVTHNKLW